MSAIRNLVQTYIRPRNDDLPQIRKSLAHPQHARIPVGSRSHLKTLTGVEQADLPVVLIKYCRIFVRQNRARSSAVRAVDS